jgi:putative ABC transport system permease protein
MFFVTYLRRELCRRTRQAVFVALGLALGVGLVITVAAASTGVKKAEAQVLGALDGIGTDVTVTGVTAVTGHPGSVQAGDPTGLGEGADGPVECFAGEGCRSVNGKTVSFVGSPYSPIATSQLAEVRRLHGVRGAVGGLMLADQTATFPKVPAHTLALLDVYLDGIDTSHASAGPPSTARLVSGRELTAADRNSSFAASNNLKVGSSLTIATASYAVNGIITQPAVSNRPTSTSCSVRPRASPPRRDKACAAT